MACSKVPNFHSPVYSFEEFLLLSVFEGQKKNTGGLHAHLNGCLLLMFTYILMSLFLVEVVGVSPKEGNAL